MQGEAGQKRQRRIHPHDRPQADPINRADGDPCFVFISTLLLCESDFDSMKRSPQ